MEPNKVPETVDNLPNTEKNGNHTVYYGVYTPNENYDPALNIFTDKIEALKLTKKNKKSRFKAFQFYHEAVEFALNGSEHPNNNTTVDGPLFSYLPQEQPQNGIGEKASPFKGPKPQELVELRKAIENGLYKVVKDTIWQNPRYLVSSGDTPSILQEGARYNALHVCAKSKNAPITELVLNTVSNAEFIKLLYGDDNAENAEQRAKILLDLYLNTPNKGLNETPLHFAAKHGADEVVEILVSYPECDRSLRNKFHMTALEINCEKVEGNCAAAKKRISVLLQQNYYVPVLRSEDRSVPPVIGQLFSPTEPLVVNTNPLSPRMEIHAYAGPMDKTGAEKFRKIWKTPPRNLSFSSPVAKKAPEDMINVSALRFKDPEKGLERIGNNLALKLDVNWKEYWPFLDSFVDITSEGGLELLEGHLYKCSEELDDSFSIKPTTIINKLDVVSPITNLCMAFQSIHLNDSFNSKSVPVAKSYDKSELNPVFYIDKACQVFSNRISNDILYILCSEYNNIAPVLETEMKQLELLVTSYMEDNRFSGVNFQKVHSRLGALVANKLRHNVDEESRLFLCDKLEYLLECITRSLDYFSSDDESASHRRDADESKRATSYKKQLICLVRVVLARMAARYDARLDLDGECACAVDWEASEECACAYHVRRAKKNSLSRSGSLKNRNLFRNGVENVSVKLCFDDDDDVATHNLNHHNTLNSSLNELMTESSSEDEEFYTPPSSPCFPDDSDSDSEFNDTKLPANDVFIEGIRPTKTDFDVFNALKYSKCALNQKTHPNVYRWRHNIALYSESERERWPSPNHLKLKQKEAKMPSTPNSSFNVSQIHDPPLSSTPSKSWLRITGANSPISAFRNLNVHF
ncbi:unnamed protein product [Brassicogethes aeneus]|uniref:ANKLE2 third alpha/beta domain-containing protein n=1 Tax=Brassicogethes aeneus TaxID=1431903 RepID=A0A9P0BC09_BRAAE|nr:unnamed protein product [Brassicogethes aeneus]